MKLTEDKKEEQLNSLQDIKNLMERSSRFTSLSGISGIGAGIIAIIGCLYVSFQLNLSIFSEAQNIMRWNNTPDEKITLKFLIQTAFIIFFLAYIAFLFLVNMKAKKINVKIFDSTGRKFIFHFLLFLISGGLFAAVLFYYNFFFLIVPSLLIFYGLALVNVSRLSFNVIRNLGLMEVILGFILCFMPGYALLFFFTGFGVLHVVYGLFVHFKYDKQAE
jgi:hypothetical protein